MTPITAEIIKEAHTALWHELANKHGGVHAVPRDERWRASETVRALWVLEMWFREAQSRHPMSLLRTYGVQDDIAQYVVSAFASEVAAQPEQKTEKRKDKWDAFDSWAREHEGQQFSIDALVEESGFTYITTLNYVKSSPLWKRVKKGLYEVLITPERESE